MKNRKQLPLVARLNQFTVNVDEILQHCGQHGLLDSSKYTDIQYSANSRHQEFLVSNEFCKTSFFTETDAPLLEGERYKQLYLTDFDESKRSDRVALESTNIFGRTRRLDPEKDQYLPEADELNYGVRNQYASGPLANLLDRFKSKITRVRLAYLTAGFAIKPHVDYDPSYITRYHIPLITNPQVIIGFERSSIEHRHHLPADGSVYFFNSGIKHWVENNSTHDRIHLIVDTHGQLDLQDLIELDSSK
jgi:hypothetical protein